MRAARNGIVSLCVLLFCGGLVWHVTQQQRANTRAALVVRMQFEEQVRLLTFRIEEQLEYIAHAATRVVEYEPLQQQLYAWSMNGKKGELAETLQVQYEALSLSRMRVMDIIGTVIYRAHSPLKRDDRVEHKEVIRRVVDDGEYVTTITEEGSSEAIVFTVLAPVEYMGQCVGYVGIGISIDDAFFSQRHTGVCVHAVQYGQDTQQLTYVTRDDVFLRRVLTTPVSRTVARSAVFQKRMQQYMSAPLSVAHAEVPGAFTVYGVNHGEESKEKEHAI